MDNWYSAIGVGWIGEVIRYFGRRGTRPSIPVSVDMGRFVYNVHFEGKNMRRSQRSFDSME